MKRVMSPLQVEGVLYAIERRFTMLPYPVGEGKSWTAIEVAELGAPNKVLVISQLNQLSGWAKAGGEITKYSNRKAVALTTEQFKKASLPVWEDYLVLSYECATLYKEKLLSWLKDLSEKGIAVVLILDEAHVLADPLSERTRAIYGALRPKKYKEGEVRRKPNTPIADYAFKVIAMSATFSRLNKISQYWTHLRYARATNLTHKQFEEQYSVLKHNGFSYVWAGNRNVDEFWETFKEVIHKPKVIDKRKAKHTIKVKELDDRGVLSRWLHDSKEDGVYQAMVQAADKALIGGGIAQFEKELSNITVINSEGLEVQANTSKIKQMLGLIKAREVVSRYTRVCRRPLVGKRSTIIWAYHREVLGELENILKSADVRYAVIKGGVPKDKREEIEKAFNSRNIEVIVAQIDAAGAGLNLQAGRVNEFVEFVGSDGAMIQAMGRIDRKDQEADTYSRIWKLNSILEDRVFKLYALRKEHRIL